MRFRAICDFTDLLDALIEEGRPVEDPLFFSRMSKEDIQKYVVGHRLKWLCGYGTADGSLPLLVFWGKTKGEGEPAALVVRDFPLRGAVRELPPDRVFLDTQDPQTIATLLDYGVAVISRQV